MFRYYLFILLSCFSLYGSEYSIVFVHVGSKAPSYAFDSITQARLFNPQARIIFLSSTSALEEMLPLLQEKNIELCSYDDLPLTQAHQFYNDHYLVNSGFWRYTSERFLYLWDLISTYKLESVFHLENDNMLYEDLETLLGDFKRLYPGIAATFDNDARCIPGLVWIANPTAMESLAQYFSKKAPEGLNDMQVIGKYRLEAPHNQVGSLPIIMPEYCTMHPLESPSHHTTTRPSSYFENAQTFHAIFDAAAIGQFLGGIDPIHANNAPGFINESCLFNPSLLEYEWIPDDKNRRVPYAVFQGQYYKIINLHIHSKRLYEFKSF